MAWKASRLENSTAEKDSGALLDKKLGMQPHIEKADSILICISKSADSRCGVVILSFSPAWVGLHKECCDFVTDLQNHQNYVSVFYIKLLAN